MGGEPEDLSKSAIGGLVLLGVPGHCASCGHLGGDGACEDFREVARFELDPVLLDKSSEVHQAAHVSADESRRARFSYMSQLLHADSPADGWMADRERPTE